MRSIICCGRFPASAGPLNSDRDLGDLLVLLPQLERLLPGLPRPAAADPETERYLLFSAVDRVLASAAQQAPLLVLLDDVHWAGRQTLELLRHLVRAGSASQADDHRHVPRRGRRARRSTGRVAGRPATQRVGHTGSARVASTRPASSSSSRLRSTKSSTGTCACWPQRRPSAAAATRSSSASCGGICSITVSSTRHEDRWTVRRDLATIGAPDSVKDVVAGRMARLSRRARRPLELAAAAGLRVEFRVLSLAADMSADDVSAGLDELVDSGFLVSVGGHLLTYQFIHALVRDTVEEVMSPSVQASLHLRIAEALEQIYEADPRSVYAELARHFGAAAAVGGGERGIRYGRLAADQAKSTGAYDEAISHLEAVLRMLPEDTRRGHRGARRPRTGPDAPRSCLQGPGHPPARLRGGPTWRMGRTGSTSRARLRGGRASARRARRAGGQDGLGGDRADR